MTLARQHVVDTVWRGRDPFAGFPGNLYQIDLQGWGEDHPYLIQSMVDYRPRIVVEVGVWKGASVIKMAAKLKQLGTDSVVIAIDTWLGSSDHWLKANWFGDLALQNGRPELQKKFMGNVLAHGLTDYVIPVPLDSLNAAHVLQAHKIELDVLHLDGGHDYVSVMSDLTAWWPLLRPGGVLIGDDYNTNGEWPEVRQAFDEYFGHAGLVPFDVLPPKCRIRKPGGGLVAVTGISDEEDLYRVTLNAPMDPAIDGWQGIEGAAPLLFRWSSESTLTWDLNVPEEPRARLEVTIPYLMQILPGFAAGSTVLIGDDRMDVEVREAAIVARTKAVVAGRTLVTLLTPEPRIPAEISLSPDRRKLGLAVPVSVP